MQNYVTVILDASKTETKFFCLDLGNGVLRIGTNRDEALGASALMLPLSDISEVRREGNTLALTSASMPPGTKPLSFQLPSASLAETWCARLSNQPAGVTSREPVVAIPTAASSAPNPYSRKPSFTKFGNGPIAPSVGKGTITSTSKPQESTSLSTGSKVIFILVLGFALLIARFVWRVIFPAPNDSPRSANNGGLTLFGLIIWLTFFGSLGLGLMASHLASRLFRERGKLTFRFREERLSFTLKNDPAKGIIVDYVGDDCETVRNGVRIRGARIKKIGPRFQIKPETSIEDVRMLIAAHTDRPLMLVFQADDRMEIDAITEWYARRVSWFGFGFSAFLFLVFYRKMFPGSGSAPTYVDPAFARVLDRPVHAPKSASSWTIIILSLVAGLIGIVAFYFYVRNLSIQAEKRRSAPFVEDSDRSIADDVRASVDVVASTARAHDAHHTTAHSPPSVLSPAPHQQQASPVPQPGTVESVFPHLEKFAAMRRKGISEFSVRRFMAKEGFEIPHGFFESLAHFPSGKVSAGSPQPVSPT